MKKGKRKSEVNKEDVSENWCFVCKDGGDLYICDYKDCPKAYHAECVGKDKSFFDKGGELTCEWHHCSSCNQKQAKYQCYCCPKAWCEGCIKYFKWAMVRDGKGFCNNCLKVLLLGEKQEEEDSDGEKVDWKDKDTTEYLLYDYWLEIKDKENLSLKDLQLADDIMRTFGKLVSDTSGSEKFTDESSESSSAEDSGSDFSMTPSRKQKRSKGDKVVTYDKFFSGNTESHYGNGSTNRNETLSNIQANCENGTTITDEALMINQGDTNRKLLSGSTQCKYGNETTKGIESPSNIQGDKVVTNDNFFTYGNGTTNGNEIPRNIQGDKVVIGLNSLSGNAGSVSANCGIGTTKTDEALMIKKGDKVVTVVNFLSGAGSVSDKCGNGTTNTDEAPTNNQDEDESNRKDQSTAAQKFELIQPGSQVQTQATNGEKIIEMESKKPVVIDLSSGSDSDSGDDSLPADLDALVWHLSGPGGDIHGPYSLSFLKKWGETASYASKCKVWKVGESQEKASMLPILVKKSYPEN